VAVAVLPEEAEEAEEAGAGRVPEKVCSVIVDIGERGFHSSFPQTNKQTEPRDYPKVK
jgi:hypothetical protein